MGKTLRAPGGPGKTKKEEIISVDVAKGISPTPHSTLTSKLNTKESNQKEPWRQVPTKSQKEQK